LFFCLNTLIFQYLNDIDNFHRYAIINKVLASLSTTKEVAMKTFSSLLCFFFSIFLSVAASAAPARVTDLSVTNVRAGQVTVTWTTPVGASLLENDVRSSTVAITAINWTSRTQTAGEPIPVTAGVKQSALVTGLASNTTYFVGLKVRDGTGWNLLSNVVSVNTGTATKEATLFWKAPNDSSWKSPSLGVRGYRVCQSKTVGVYTNCVDVGNFTSLACTTTQRRFLLPGTERRGRGHPGIQPWSRVASRMRCLKTKRRRKNV
jgi:hypothetical protein